METSFSVELYHAMANASFSRSDKIYFSANWSEGNMFILNPSYHFLLPQWFSLLSTVEKVCGKTNIFDCWNEDNFVLAVYSV